jgi:hypothetical protein
MHDHLAQVAIVLGGMISGFIGFMFDVPAATLWTAAFGSALGVAFRPASEMKIGAALIIVGAAAIALLVPLVMPGLSEGVPQKSVSFLLALVTIGGRNLLPEITEGVMRAIGARLVGFISNFGKKDPNGSGDPKP